MLTVLNQSYLRICSKPRLESQSDGQPGHSVSARRPRARTLFYVFTAKRRDSSIVYLQYSSIIPGGVARAPNRNILYLLYGHYSTSKRTVAGSIPDSSIFRKRFKNSWQNDLLTLAATRCVMPSTVAKKIFRADHHARRRIKNKIPGAFRC